MANFLSGVSDFLGGDMAAVLQNGNGVEADYLNFKKNIDLESGSNTLLSNNPKIGATSYMNEYAFISYGGEYINGSYVNYINNWAGVDDIVAIDGLVAGHDLWKNPTAKNIIEWSKSVLENQKQPKNIPTPDITYTSIDENGNKILRERGINSTAGSQEEAIAEADIKVEENKSIDETSRTNLPPTLGALKYEWKDFAFCKNFGSIPNNRLITLRRFKLPTLDSGAVIGRETLVNDIKTFGKNAAEYLNSDSARALTYFGDGTGNNINNFVGFNFNLNWTSRTTSLENPKINETGLQGANPFSKKNIQASIPIIGDFLNGLSVGNDPSLIQRNVSAFGLFSNVQNKSDDVIASGDINPGTADDIKKTGRDIALENREFDAYSTSWQYKIYGPINVISNTYTRGRGLSFNNSDISLVFEYDVMQVDNLNHKLAMLDIISNILALTYADATWYGGDYRFIPQPTDFPLDSTLINSLQRLASGDNVDFGAIGDKLFGMIYDNFKKAKNFITDGAENAMTSGSAALDNFKKALEELELNYRNIKNVKTGNTTANTATNTSTTTNTVPSTSINGEDNDDSFNIFSNLKPGILEIIKAANASEDIKVNPLTYVAAGSLGKGYSISSIAENLSVVTPLFTGEPIGEWHLTIGNPMNPFMMIGNLICTNCKIEFNDILGPDDFPTQLKATIHLRHARDRDKGDIESMFNFGQGRFYINIEGKPEPWNTGFSSKDSGNFSSSNTNGNNGNNGNNSTNVNNGSTIPSITPELDAIQEQIQSGITSRNNAQFGVNPNFKMPW